MKFKLFSIFLLLAFHVSVHAQLEYSKIEHQGCPENAYCTKESGIVRDTWKNDLLKLKTNNESSKKIIAKYQKDIGIPIAVYAKEDARLLPNIALWDSNCSHHKRENDIYYLGDAFMKSLKDDELQLYNNLYVTKAYRQSDDKKITPHKITRDDSIPYFISNKGFHYLKSEEGPFYGLIIANDGSLTLQSLEDFMNLKNKQTIPSTSEAICSVELINALKTDIPYSDFYKIYYCKNIWNIDLKKFETVIFGRGCE